MDASEHDLDARLYKASGVLLSELHSKLPSLVFVTRRSPARPRLRILDTKTEELRLLLDRFQEWPQLLDPALSNLIQLLTEAFTGYVATSSNCYGPTEGNGTASVSPLPRAICRLLYAFCKVRGYKVIVRLLNNEPKYLALLLPAFQAWKSPSRGMTWEERYIMTLWLSHLMLAPFELASMSISSSPALPTDLASAIGRIPGIASDITSLAFQQLESSGKEREAARVLLVRLSLRKDMQLLDLPQKLVNHATQTLISDNDLATLGPYRALGLLSLVYGLMNSGSDGDVAPFLQHVFQTILTVATSQSRQFSSIRDSAPARKWVLKILRIILTHAISLNSKIVTIPPADLNTMLEESIQHFLDALSDKDTPVRMTAAKALSVVALHLDPAMSAEVVEAVLACLDENVLLEDSHSGKLIAITDQATSDVLRMRRNISAVDPLRWHGLMLTLAHLLFRRSPPPSMLPKIIQALILGIEFEQRSNVGTSVGVGVRDAACFGFWALARKYSTSELDLIPISQFAEANSVEFSRCQSVLQLIAIKLTLAACLDPSGNIRRGSSAALQELIGRHPDTVISGISVVQIVDYHAVARLSRALTDVVPQAAAMSGVYHRPLLQALTDWRGSRATDVNQRRWAARAIRALTRPLEVREILSFAQQILHQLFNLKLINIGSTAAARHGILLGLASALKSVTEHDAEAAASWMAGDGRRLLSLKDLTGKMDGRVTADIELVMEAVASLVQAICQTLIITTSLPQTLSQSWTSTAEDVLNQCTVSGGREIVVQASANATVELIKLLPHPADTATIESWLDNTRQPPSAFSSKGRIKSLSLIHSWLSKEAKYSEIRHSIATYVMNIIEGSYKIETRVDAMEALGVILAGAKVYTAEESTNLCRILECGLTDYTNDQRGDIGSILRLQSIETVNAFRRNQIMHVQTDGIVDDVMPLVVKLAAEKLNNVRFRAWKCLESFWQTDARLPAPTRTFHYPTDVSSVTYFQQLMKLLKVPWAQNSLVEGIVSSVTSGSEDISRAAGTALVLSLEDLDPGKRNELMTAISSIVAKLLAERTTEDDRQIVPVLDFLCFLMDQDLFSTRLIQGPGEDTIDLWIIMQKIHGPSSSLQRTEASLNIYSRLLSFDNYQVRALDKLTRQLLHRWPKVRNTAADLLYLNQSDDLLASCDWSGPVVKTKPVVLKLRKQLGVAGNGAFKA